MDRFSISRVETIDERGDNAPTNELTLNPNTLHPNMANRRNSRTVPAKLYDDRRKFSLAQLTREALPRLDNYRMSKRALKRPSLGELHGDPEPKTENLDTEAPESGAHGHGIKLGWIVGVLIPCLLNIWGVMLFLRLSWVVGQAGIGGSLIIIGISTLVCVITTLSLSAISTNGDVKGGGIYYIISRSLGPEFGASVGVVFAFANAVAASMNTIGFCSSLNDLLKEHGLKIVDGGLNDIRIVGVIALLIMVIICAVGMEWEAKAQNFLVAIIMVAIADFLIGTLLGPSDDLEKAQGFEGFQTEIFTTNWYSDFRFSENVDQTFFSVFAIFFPSVTGIQAGANISGDLKDPAGAIPKGTMLALLISMFSYALFVFFAGGAALRDASGSLTDLANGTLSNCSETLSCHYGLQNSYTVMQLMSLWGPIIYAGCFAATLSTALTNLLSVPRLIQALGIDKIYPGVIFFSKGYGKHGEPYRGYVLTFIISALFLLIAELNLIAPLISTFYLASYALINYCTFHAALVKPLGWRPTFRYYNVWLSLFGFLLCIAIMFLIDYVSSVITLLVIAALYLIVLYRKPDVNWGSSTQAQTYKTALAAAYRLQNVSDHVKNYHPQVLVLTGKPQNRPPLIDLAHLLTKHHSLLVVGDCVPEKLAYRNRMAQMKEGNKWLDVRKVKGFYTIVDGLNLEEGVRTLIQNAGIGKLAPNIVLMGYKSDWRTCNPNELIEYFKILHNAFGNRMAVAILRLPNGINFSYLNLDIQFSDTPPVGLSVNNSAAQLPTVMSSSNLSVYDSELIGGINVKSRKLMHADSNLNIEALGGGSNSNTITVPMPPPMPNQKRLKQLKEMKEAAEDNLVYSTRGGSAVPKEILDAMGIFNRRQPKGTIDVWWLYDDGGLTMLLPHILSSRSAWSNCKIRVFALTNRKLELEVEERNMANLLFKLRIDYASLTMLQGVTEKPTSETIAMHEKLLDGFTEEENPTCFISETEKLTLREKTYRQLRLRELLIEHSHDASLIVMSLPMPRQGTVSAPLYMSWLEMLTKEMPPMLLVRGNQSSVLTFYS